MDPLQLGKLQVEDEQLKDGMRSQVTEMTY
jgi:hypothetical protein